MVEEERLNLYPGIVPFKLYFVFIFGPFKFIFPVLISISGSFIFTPGIFPSIE